MTLFWICAGGLALLCAFYMSLSVLRAKETTIPAAHYDITIYRDQLAEVERDLQRGLINAQEAERLRNEISRRILAADAQMSQSLQIDTGADGFWRAFSLFFIGGILIIGSGFLYIELGAPGYRDRPRAERLAEAEAFRTSRQSQSEALAQLAASTPPASPGPLPEGYSELVDQLRATVLERPNDEEGLRLLVQAEARLGDFAAASAAQERLISLKDARASAEDFAQLADLMVLAARGYISPQAEQAALTAIELDPNEPTARYYLGLMFAQTGRPDRALRLWDSLLREGPADAPWIEPIQSQIPDIAQRAGVDYVIPTPRQQRGPNAAQIEAAEDLSPAERMEMIRSMVSSLSTRLAEEGGPVEDWARLITSLGVLGQIDDAARIYRNGLEVFAGDLAALDTLNRAAERLGIR